MTLALIALVLIVAAWLSWLWRTLASGGSGLRPPQPPGRHWSAGDRAQLPDSPYRSLGRVA